MAEDQKTPYKILNVTITTNDPLTAEVLASARSVKRLNAVLGMMLEAYLATPEGQVMAAQQLRVPVSELMNNKGTLAAVPAHAAAPASEETAVGAPGAKAINFDKLCA